MRSVILRTLFFLLSFWIVRCRALPMEDGILSSRAWGCHDIIESIGVIFFGRIRPVPVHSSGEVMVWSDPCVVG